MVSTLSLAAVEISSLHEVGYTIGIAIVTAVSAYSAYQSSQAKSVGEQINDAVNNRHEKAGPNAPKLYDAVIHLHERTDHIDKKADELLEWKRTYDEGPLSNGPKVIAFVESVHELKDQVDDLSKSWQETEQEGDDDGCDG